MSRIREGFFLLTQLAPDIEDVYLRAKKKKKLISKTPKYKRNSGTHWCLYGRSCLRWCTYWALSNDAKICLHQAPRDVVIRFRLRSIAIENTACVYRSFLEPILHCFSSRVGMIIAVSRNLRLKQRNRNTNSKPHSVKRMRMTTPGETIEGLADCERI